jgi:hypothetical protein
MNYNRDKPKPGEMYRHFKGNQYVVICTGVSSDDINVEMIAYRALYDDSVIFFRRLDEFMSEVDHAKYPDSEATFRFTLISEEG